VSDGRTSATRIRANSGTSRGAPIVANEGEPMVDEVGARFELSTEDVAENIGRVELGGAICSAGHGLKVVREGGAAAEGALRNFEPSRAEGTGFGWDGTGFDVRADEVGARDGG